MDIVDQLLAVLHILGKEKLLEARKRALINGSLEEVISVGSLLGGKLEIKVTFDETN